MILRVNDVFKSLVWFYYKNVSSQLLRPILCPTCPPVTLRFREKCLPKKLPLKTLLCHSSLHVFISYIGFIKVVVVGSKIGFSACFWDKRTRNECESDLCSNEHYLNGSENEELGQLNQHNDWLINWFIGWLSDSSTDRLMDWPTDWLPACLTDWLTRRMTDWRLTDWLTEWLAEWLTD